KANGLDRSAAISDMARIDMDSLLNPMVPAPLGRSRPSPEPSELFDKFWYFAAERQTVLAKRLRGDEPPWTVDPVLLSYRFTNAYRASDRTSQYLIAHVIYE